MNDIRSLLIPVSVWMTAIAGLISSKAAADKPPEHPPSVAEVVVKGQLLMADEMPFTVTVLVTEEIRDKGHADLDEMLRHVPGMTVRDLQLGSVASNIVIRGFGSGGHGGDLGAVIDGIPLNEAMSHADGYVDLNTVIPIEIGALTVYKGPVSVLYGNYNRGGLISIETRKGGEYLEANLAAGSFDTMDLELAWGGSPLEGQQMNLAGQVYRTDGFRPQSSTEREVIAGRWSLDITPTLQLAVSGGWFHARSDSASYLTLDEFRVNPRGIHPGVVGDGADKDLHSVRADLLYAMSDDLKMLTFAYVTGQEFTRWFTRPVNAPDWRQREESYDRRVFGAGTSLNGTQTIGGTTLRYVAGIETFHETTEYLYFDGTENRRRVSPALSDRETELNSVSVFGELHADLHPWAQPFAGLRADRFTGGCTRLGPETGGDPCGDLNDASHLSPKIGLRSQLVDWLELRASWAEGFALANGFVKYDIGGQPLDETVFRQTEVGFRLLMPHRLDLDVAAFRLKSTGEVRTVAPGVYENFGATLRRGIEAAATWKPLDAMELRVVYGLTDSEVRRNADPQLLGRSVPGVPEESLTLEAIVEPFAGWTLEAAWRHVGDYAVDALNTFETGSHDLVDLMLAYTRAGEHPFRVYLAVDNLTDREYGTSFSIIGGERVVAPGAPRSVRAGIQLDW